MLDSVKTRTLSGRAILPLGVMLFLMSFASPVLRGGNSPVAALIAFVGILAIGASVSLCVATEATLTERQARGICVLLESLVLSTGGAAFAILVEGGSFFVSLAGLHAILVLVCVGLFGFAALALFSMMRQSYAAFRSRDESLFTIGGRIGRLDFWLTGILLALINVVVNVFITAQGRDRDTGLLLALTLYLAWLPPSIRTGFAYQIKRWHDRGKSGWMVLIGLIPIIGWIWALVELGLRRGTSGPNNYGDEPRQIKSQQDARVAV